MTLEITLEKGKEFTLAGTLYAVRAAFINTDYDDNCYSYHTRFYKVNNPYIQYHLYNFYSPDGGGESDYEEKIYIDGKQVRLGRIDNKLTLFY